MPVTELQTEQPQLSTHQLPQQLTALSQQLSQSLTLDISANGISECRICLIPAVDPVYPILGDGRPCDKYAENGRHWFCAACLKDAFVMNPCCPICKEEIEQMHWRGSSKDIMLRKVHRISLPTQFAHTLKLFRFHSRLLSRFLHASQLLLVCTAA